MKNNQNETLTRTAEENKTMANMNQKLKEIYNWDGKKSFLYMAVQNCSDMLLYVCKF